MIYKIGESKHLRVRKKILRQLRWFGAPALVIVVGMVFALQDGKLAVVLAELAGKEETALGSTSSNVAGNSKMPPKMAADKKTKAGQVAGATVDTVRAVAECNVSAAKHANLTGSSISQLRKLAEYESICNAGIAERASFFVPTPKTTAEATEHAAWVSDVLKEFAKQGVAPLVIMEPTGNGGNLSFKSYSEGAYDAALDAYFAGLKANGITDQMMGIWVPFPEANIPVWDSVDPTLFALNVNKTVQFQKKHFPASQASIMLDSQTYPSASSWEGGKYASLLPYVNGVDKGLVDSFGLQGFPWAPPANEAGPAKYDAKAFLPVGLAIEAAKSMGVKDVWLNTGTFAKQYAKDAKKTVALTPAQRQTMLNGILAQTDSLRAAGMRPTIHLFAENKSSTAEGIDWSYWTRGQASASPASAVFKTFVHDAAAKGLPLWIYDSEG